MRRAGINSKGEHYIEEGSIYVSRGENTTMHDGSVEVSIVMPIYNKDRYLKEALETIRRQTCRQIEIICINDASTDGSLDILQEMAQEDDRIIIINHEENQGAGASRNEGLYQACGEYICFMDADDIYRENILEKELKAIKRNYADIAVVEIVDFQDGERIPDIYYEGSERTEACYCMKDSQENLLSKWRWLPSSKMYRRRFILDQGLEYQCIRAANDVYFYIMAFMTAERIVHVGCDTPMGYYRTGITGQITSYRKAMDVYEAFEKIYHEMHRRGIWYNYYEYFYECLWGCIKGEWMRCVEDDINKESYMFLRNQGLQQVGFGELARGQFKNSYIFDCLTNIREMEYGSLWFLNFEEVLKRRGERIDKLLRRYEEENKAVALWGAAVRGSIFLRHSIEKGWNIAFVIDNDVRKWGAQIEKWVIHGLDEVSHQINAVIVLRDRFCAEIIQKIEEKELKIEIINLEKILLEEINE